MLLFPNIPDPSSYNNMLAYPHHLLTNHDYATKHHNASFDHHHLSDVVHDFFSHMFAPTSYLQCTSSIPCWAPPAIDAHAADTQPRLIIDDDYVLLDCEEDGGPLCREATIASWKAAPTKEKQRRRSIQWLASVIRTEST
jgi:hypothetical protein